MPNNYKGLNISGLKSTTKLARVQVEPTIDFVELTDRGSISENTIKMRTAGAGHRKLPNANANARAISTVGETIDMGGLRESASEYDYGTVSVDAFTVDEDDLWIKRRKRHSVTLPSIDYDTTYLIKGVFNPLSASNYDNYSVSTADGTLDGTERGGAGLGPVAGTSFDSTESPYASGVGATYHLYNHYYKIGSDYVNRTGSFSGAFTFEMWIKCETTPSTNGGTILGYDGASGGGKIYIGGAGNGNKLYFRNLQQGTRGCEITRNDIGDGNWHHIAWTRDGNGDNRVFFDGVQKSTSPVTAETNYYNPITFPDASWNDTSTWQSGWQPYIYCAQTSGWTTDVRWINGGALYTSSFTPPTATLTATP